MNHIWIKRIVILIAAALAVSLGWYFFYWRDTPQYAASEIQQAVQEKDSDLLQKRTDLNQLYSSALDDVIDELHEHPRDNSELIATLLQNFKPQVTSLLIEATRQDFENKQSKSSKGPAASASRWIQNYVGSSALSALKVIQIEKQGNQAICSFSIHDKKLNHDFTWKVAMEKDINGTWTAVKILNFKDYLEERASLEK